MERAKANLLRIDLVGVQEHFDDFCDVLAERFDWDLGPPQVANRTEAGHVDQAFAERIAHDNRLDVELHRFALHLWHERHAPRADDGAGVTA